ncbi:Fe(2+)-trafficking protein [Poriferisphaera sp. WC338]|uniref:Fe(2+)-trafficking protein n=1 Tax=Poriferisphaera sp. WC338 TaxID=3425129 RepID=UPI003D814FC8
MANIEERIAQWEQMAASAPDDMAFFSLGNAYKDAERHEDAEAAYEKAIGLNPGMSRAYQFRGQCLIKLGRNDDAAAVLETGYKTAAERGDVMPQKAIGSLLTEKLGKTLPDVSEAEAKRAEVEASGDMILDRRTGQPQPKLPDPPMRGPVGAFIYANFGQDTWREWIGQGTKVINELRLDFSDPNSQDIYEQYMLEWLGVSKDEIESAE